LSFNALNSLRQHIRPSSRIHGIIVDGGKAANVVPGHSAGSFLVRSDDQQYLEDLKRKVLDCFTGASVATGTRLEYRWGQRPFAALLSNNILADLFATNMALLGRNMERAETASGPGSTDMGNVSRVMPAIHPSVAVSSKDVTIHTAEFARAAVSENGDRGLIDGAKALTMTVADLLFSPGLIKDAWEEFRARSQCSSAH